MADEKLSWPEVLTIAERWQLTQIPICLTVTENKDTFSCTATIIQVKDQSIEFGHHSSDLKYSICDSDLICTDGRVSVTLDPSTDKLLAELKSGASLAAEPSVEK